MIIAIRCYVKVTYESKLHALYVQIDMKFRCMYKAMNCIKSKQDNNVY